MGRIGSASVAGLLHNRSSPGHSCLQLGCPTGILLLRMVSGFYPAEEPFCDVLSKTEEHLCEAKTKKRTRKRTTQQVLMVEEGPSGDSAALVVLWRSDGPQHQHLVVRLWEKI